MYYLKDPALCTWTAMSCTPSLPDYALRGEAVSYTHLDVYKRQCGRSLRSVAADINCYCMICRQVTAIEAISIGCFVTQQIHTNGFACCRKTKPGTRPVSYTHLDVYKRQAQNTRYFRERMTEAGFDIRPGVHPISPVMLYDAPLAQQFAARLLEEGIYAIGFFFPVVAKGQARIRTQMSAAHTREHLDRAIDAFTRIGRELGVI